MDVKMRDGQRTSGAVSGGELSALATALLGVAVVVLTSCGGAAEPKSPLTGPGARCSMVPSSLSGDLKFTVRCGRETQLGKAWCEEGCSASLDVKYHAQKTHGSGASGTISVDGGCSPNGDGAECTFARGTATRTLDGKRAEIQTKYDGFVWTNITGQPEISIRVRENERCLSCPPSRLRHYDFVNARAESGDAVRVVDVIKSMENKTSSKPAVAASAAPTPQPPPTTAEPSEAMSLTTEQSALIAKLDQWARAGIQIAWSKKSQHIDTCANAVGYVVPCNSAAALKHDSKIISTISATVTNRSGVLLGCKLDDPQQAAMRKVTSSPPPAPTGIPANGSHAFTTSIDYLHTLLPADDLSDFKVEIYCGTLFGEVAPKLKLAPTAVPSDAVVGVLIHYGVDSKVSKYAVGFDNRGPFLREGEASRDISRAPRWSF